MRPLQSVLIFAAFLIASPAHAGDSTCPWSRLSPSVRASAMAAGLDGGPSAFSNEIPPAELEQAEKACGLRPDNADALHRAESGYMLQILAQAWLQQNAKLSEQELNAAWASMGEDAKAPIKRWAATLESDPVGRDLAYDAFVKALGNAGKNVPADTKPKIVTYIQGRSLRTVFDDQF